MFELIRQTDRKLTTKLAQEHFAVKPWPGDRGSKSHRTQYIRQEIDAGRFHGCVWATFYCEENGQTFRVNGNHTSQIFSDPSVERGNIKITMKEFKGKTMEDGAECYQTFDDPISSRTSSDSNRAVAGCIPELAKLPVRLINTCVTGMSLSTFGSGYGGDKKGSRKERAALLLGNEQFCHFVYKILYEGESDFLNRGPVAAAMFESFKEAPQLAGTFWESVRDGSNPNPKSIERKLQRYLMQKKISHGRGAQGVRTQKHHVSREEMFAQCTAEWAKWLKVNKG